jgi:hypothetical protein
VNPCRVCACHLRDEVDDGLRHNLPLSGLSRAYNLSRESLRRHRESHLPTARPSVANAHDEMAANAHAGAHVARHAVAAAAGGQHAPRPAPEALENPPVSATVAQQATVPLAPCPTRFSAFGVEFITQVPLPGQDAPAQTPQTWAAVPPDERRRGGGWYLT